MITWLSNLGNIKALGLVIFFMIFVGIVLWVYGSKKRSQKLESYKNIPFLDDESDVKERKP
jgi:cbb3-type cytochrome oxidase subunit 3